MQTDMRRLGLILAAMTVGSTCGGGDDKKDDTAGGGATSSALQTACDQRAKAHCERFMTCAGALRLAEEWGDQATCEKRLALDCVTELESPMVSSTAESTTACAGELGAQACEDFLYGRPTPSCARKPGKAADGAPCVRDEECASTSCNVPRGAACGTCETGLQENAPCGMAGTSCVFGLSCEGPRNMQVCRRPAAQGAACSANSDCDDGLDCVGASNMAQGTCQPEIKMEGAACDRNRRMMATCASALNLSCDRMTATCVKGAEDLVAKVGEPCGDQADDTEIECAAGGYCYRPGGADMGTCKPSLPEGSPCSLVDSDTPCLEPAECIAPAPGAAATCKVRKLSLCRG